MNIEGGSEEQQVAPRIPRVIPNILVTGVPGSGKTTLCTVLVDQLNSSLNLALGLESNPQEFYKYLSTADIVKNNVFWEEYDEKMECTVMDIDKTLDFMEEHVAAGGKIVEFHSCDFFPERWFDIVVLIRCDNSVLHKRMTEREYNQDKISENSKNSKDDFLAYVSSTM